MEEINLQQSKMVVVKVQNNVVENEVVYLCNAIFIRARKKTHTYIDLFRCLSPLSPF